MSIRKPKPTAAVKLIREAFNAAALDSKAPSTKEVYNLLAQLEGYKNWAHAKEFLEAPKAARVKKDPGYPMGYLEAEIANWTTFVIFMSYDHASSFDEELFMMPPGSTFENNNAHTRYGNPFKEAGSVLLPELFEGIADPKAIAIKRMTSFVVKEVFSVIPRPERYGIPYYANELGVKKWILEDLGWNYLAYDDGCGNKPCAVDVGFNDSGDDGGGRYWMEVAVAPDVAEQLVAGYHQRRVDLEASGEEDPFDTGSDD